MHETSLHCTRDRHKLIAVNVLYSYLEIITDCRILKNCDISIMFEFCKAMLVRKWFQIEMGTKQNTRLGLTTHTQRNIWSATTATLCCSQSDPVTAIQRNRLLTHARLSFRENQTAVSTRPCLLCYWPILLNWNGTGTFWSNLFLFLVLEFSDSIWSKISQ